MRWERELASVRGTSPVHKQEGELNAKASLHANAECEVRAVEHVTLCERWTRGGLQQDGGTSPETRNRNFRKENISKAYTETKEVGMKASCVIPLDVVVANQGGRTKRIGTRIQKIGGDFCRRVKGNFCDVCRRV